MARKTLRTGFTTGTAAAAATRAAVLMAQTGALLDEVEVTLPGGNKMTLPLCRREIGESFAVAAVRKDGGDDPDITSGLEIGARATLRHGGGITVGGGAGVGTVTLKGLKVPVGEVAINPVPRQMIREHAERALAAGMGADIAIFIPGGEEVAKKTFNPKLGIEGGLSILGSTGIVQPMSEEALKESLSLELKVLLGRGYDEVVFAFGNYGLSFLADQGIGASRVVKIGNYLGFMLEEAADLGLKRLLLVGHLGKLTKVAGGIFQTHSKVADCRLEILTAYAALAGADQQTAAQIYGCKTTAAAEEVIAAQGLDDIYRRIGEEAARRCHEYVGETVGIGVVLFGESSRQPLYQNTLAGEMVEEWQNEG